MSSVNMDREPEKHPPTSVELEQESPKAPARSWSPHPKVAMSGVGASLATVLVWGAAQMGLALPVEVAVAAAGLIIFVLGYLTPGK